MRKIYLNSGTISHRMELNTLLSNIKGIPPRFLPKLKKLGIETAQDLLWHIPSRYVDFSRVLPISELKPQEEATIHGTVEKVRARRTWKRNLYLMEAFISDDSGTIRATWFNQPYIKNILIPGREANFSGKPTLSKDGELYLSNPTYELVSSPETDTKHTARIVPIYSETRGLTSKGIRYLVSILFKQNILLEETLPKSILDSEKFPALHEAIHAVHFPDTLDDAAHAKRRFAFEDLFLLQLRNVTERTKLNHLKAHPTPPNVELIKELIDELPFPLTISQKKSLWEILQGLEKSHPMNRLLQGDVGSGKTIVAALAAMNVAEAGLQAAFMAPTEILARQHYQTIKKFFPEFSGGTALLTSSEARIFYGQGMETITRKPAILRELSAGRIKIIIGTHALIQKNVVIPNLALVVIDEQHRFGVNQRKALVRGFTQTETQNNADKNIDETQNTETFLYSDLTYKLRGCAFIVKKNIGLGHKETVYQKALALELTKAGVVYEQEKRISITYDGKKIGTYQPDFLIDNKIIVELKALPFIGNKEKKQLWSYLKGSPYKLAVLINFAPNDIHFERLVYDSARGSQRESASSQRQSALVPHLLSMSATPIPRTLSLTIFGDLDLSLINELPKNRKVIITKVIPPTERDHAYHFIREQIKEGRQAFVICPRIEQTIQLNDEGIELSDLEIARIEMKNVKDEYEKLSKKIFPEFEVGMLHGKLHPKEKERIMKKFACGEINILVATSVVEVGVDIPNATVMMIESAERFGLAQLYQFRGRVGRGEYQSHCLLFTESKSQETKKRLLSIVEAKNGFELAEKDLAIRGPGEFLGEIQTGMPDIAMTALQNPELVKRSRELALALLRDDLPLKNHSLLKSQLEQFEKSVHLE